MHPRRTSYTTKLTEYMLPYYLYKYREEMMEKENILSMMEVKRIPKRKMNGRSERKVVRTTVPYITGLGPTSIY